MVSKHDIMMQFNKGDLRNIAESLSIPVNSQDRSKDILDGILQLIGDGVVTDNPDVLQFIKYVTNKDGEIVINRRMNIKYNEPNAPCFGLADKSDPACKRCNIYDECYRKRVELRPNCFGNFNEDNAVCRHCFEYSACYDITEKTDG